VVNPPNYVAPKVTLSAEHQTLCNNTLRGLNDFIPILSDVQACGVDCSAYAALRDKLVEIATEIKARFCDNKPLPGM